MQRFLLTLLIFPLYLLAIDSDFDGVEDDVDACLDTGMLDIVNADGCSKAQSDTLNIMLLQTFSYLKVDANSHLNNYNLALMVTKDEWLFYLGSGYFRYETQKDITDTTFLAQKSFLLAPNHQLKASLSASFPTYTAEGNNIDYSTELSYLLAYQDFDLEMGYRYDIIRDTGAKNIETPFVYFGYTLDKLHTSLGYSQDSEARTNYNFLLHYNYSSSYTFSYSFIKANKNLYENIHTVGVGYLF